MTVQHFWQSWMQECLVVPRENTANLKLFRPEELSLDSHVPRKNTANLKVLRLKKLSLDGHALRKEHCESEGAHPATPHQMFYFRQHVPNALY